jgi:hypothetical protein
VLWEGCHRTKVMDCGSDVFILSNLLSLAAGFGEIFGETHGCGEFSPAIRPRVVRVPLFSAAHSIARVEVGVIAGMYAWWVRQNDPLQSGVVFYNCGSWLQQML